VCVKHTAYCEGTVGSGVRCCWLRRHTQRIVTDIEVVDRKRPANYVVGNACCLLACLLACTCCMLLTCLHACTPCLRPLLACLHACAPCMLPCIYVAHKSIRRATLIYGATIVRALPRAYLQPPKHEICYVFHSSGASQSIFAACKA
jgi:hypothetical protein